MAFSYKAYEKEFVRRTKELRRAYQKGDLFKTICYLRYLTNFYYMINYKLTDDELEEIISGVADQLLGETFLENCDERTVLFYDNFGLLTRGLANIYVKALVNCGFHVVWVLYDFLPDVAQLQNYYADMNDIEFCVIPKQSIIDRMKSLRQIILQKRPRHIFVYTTPDDIAGVGVMSTIKGNVDRYLIDLTDHAFWVGKCAVDWIIGFRSYGYNVAVQYRKIIPEKVLILPYYPDEREEYPFEGMPFDVGENEYVFSGGSPYKIEGSAVYEEIVEYILNHYSGMKFVFADNGTNQTLEKLKCAYPNRFYHINERKDLDAILRRAKFYLSTYPLAGGLMTQFALQAQCIPFTLCRKKNTLSDIKGMMLAPSKADFIFYSKEELFMAVDKVMCDENYRYRMKESLSGQVISKDQFEQELRQLVLEKKTSFPRKIEKIDIESFVEIYRKNATYELFCKLVYDSRNKWVYRKHPFIVRREKRKRAQ